MNTSNLNVKLFNDKYLGEAGFFIWIIPIALTFFIYLFFSSVYELATMSYDSLNNILFICLCIILFLTISLWFIYELYIASMLFQKTKISNIYILGVTYFRRRINIPIHEIYSVITLEQNSFLLKKHRAVQTDKPCLQIKTKDNKNYLITPHMERFEELRATLIELVEQNKKLIHDKNKSTRL